MEKFPVCCKLLSNLPASLGSVDSHRLGDRQGHFGESIKSGRPSWLASPGFQALQGILDILPDLEEGFAAMQDEGAPQEVPHTKILKVQFWDG